MSDHYCCKGCGQRDECRSDCPKMFPKKSVAAKPRMDPTKVLVVGYGNVGRASLKHMREATKMGTLHSDPTYEFTITDLRPITTKKTLDGCRFVTDSYLRLAEMLFKEHEVIVLCLPSDQLECWMGSYKEYLAGKVVIIRSTLEPKDKVMVEREFRLTDYAYIPEYQTEHKMATTRTCIMREVYANTLPTLTITDRLFGSNLTQIDNLNVVIGRKLLHNAAQAVNAVFHNEALAWMIHNGVDPAWINTYELLDTEPQIGRVRPSLPRGLAFGGKCLEPSLYMLADSHSATGVVNFWESIADANLRLRWYARMLKHFVTNYKPHRGTFNLVIAGLNYHALEPGSTFKGSAASQMPSLLKMEKFNVFFASNSTKKQLEEAKQMYPEIKMNTVNNATHGVVLLQPIQDRSFTIRMAMPTVHKPFSGSRTPKPFVVFDPLHQVMASDLKNVAKYNRIPITIVHKIE